ncbi:MAG TPA: thymidine phosphorylase [Longimicrobiales bacterium]|nr:thymidine phosphorylase [Longimicrobiales bacterium]
MHPAALIRRKRDGGEIPVPALRTFLRGYSAGEVPDYQVSAFLMATVFRGLGNAELETLVEIILESGRRVDFGDAPGRRVDKHSTGGVGDKVSLVLAPLVASLGVQVPMMSGRGLGHTGGTVDKLESIPGFRMDLPLDRFRAQVLETGAALISQTPEIAPLDGRLYALRDVTATVESIPLIAASIMSKKIAEGIDALVLDVKVGNGAFLPDPSDGVALAETMIAIGARYGLEVVALQTAMDRPLGVAVGNALEVVEAVEALRGGGPDDLREVTVALAGEMLALGGAADSPEAGRDLAGGALDDGRALETMAAILSAQGGDPRVLEDPTRLPGAPVRAALEADRAGLLLAMDTRALGDVAVSLGAGRRQVGDAVDPAVGFRVLAKPGDRVEPGQPLVEVHARDHVAADRALEALRSAITVGEGDVVRAPLVSRRITRAGSEPLSYPD